MKRLHGIAELVPFSYGDFRPSTIDSGTGMSAVGVLALVFCKFK